MHDFGFPGLAGEMTSPSLQNHLLFHRVRVDRTTGSGSE